MGYKIHAFKGVSWMVLLRGSTRGITFVRLAILARILTPAQFGVFGVATLVLALLETLTETGINVFLIQEKDDAKQYLNSAWIVSIMRGCLIALALIVSAPLIVKFFHSPESYKIILLIAVVPFLRGFINPSIVYIQKEIQFQKEFLLRLALFSVDAAVAIFTALITRSAESFAYGLIASAIVEIVLSYIFFRPFPSFNTEFHKVTHIIRRGWWVTLTGIFLYIADNGDNAIVGRILGTSPLGLYQIAYKFSTLPISEITEVVNKVVFPVYSKFPNDNKRLIQAFVKVTLISSLLAVFLGIFIFVFSKEIILLLLGPIWVAAVPAIKILALYGVLRTIFGNFSPLALAMKKQNYVAKATLLRCLGLLITIVPLTSRYGLIGAGASVLLSMFFEIPLIIYYLSKMFSLNDLKTWQGKDEVAT